MKPRAPPVRPSAPPQRPSSDPSAHPSAAVRVGKYTPSKALGGDFSAVKESQKPTNEQKEQHQGRCIKLGSREKEAFQSELLQEFEQDEHSERSILISMESLQRALLHHEDVSAPMQALLADRENGIADAQETEPAGRTSESVENTRRKEEAVVEDETLLQNSEVVALVEGGPKQSTPICHTQQKVMDKMLHVKKLESDDRCLIELREKMARGDFRVPLSILSAKIVFLQRKNGANSSSLVPNSSVQPQPQAPYLPHSATSQPATVIVPTAPTGAAVAVESSAVESFERLNYMIALSDRPKASHGRLSVSPQKRSPLREPQLPLSTSKGIPPQATAREGQRKGWPQKKRSNSHPDVHPPNRLLLAPTRANGICALPGYQKPFRPNRDLRMRITQLMKLEHLARQAIIQEQRNSTIQEMILTTILLENTARVLTEIKQKRIRASLVRTFRLGLSSETGGNIYTSALRSSYLPAYMLRPPHQCSGDSSLNVDEVEKERKSPWRHPSKVVNLLGRPLPHEEFRSTSPPTTSTSKAHRGVSPIQKRPSTSDPHSNPSPDHANPEQSHVLDKMKGEQVPQQFTERFYYQPCANSKAHVKKLEEAYGLAGPHQPALKLSKDMLERRVLWLHKISEERRQANRQALLDKIKEQEISQNIELEQCGPPTARKRRLTAIEERTVVGRLYSEAMEEHKKVMEKLQDQYLISPLLPSCFKPAVPRRAKSAEPTPRQQHQQQQQQESNEHQRQELGLAPEEAKCGPKPRKLFYPKPPSSAKPNGGGSRMKEPSPSYREALRRHQQALARLEQELLCGPVTKQTSPRCHNPGIASAELPSKSSQPPVYLEAAAPSSSSSSGIRGRSPYLWALKRAVEAQRVPKPPPKISAE